MKLIPSLIFGLASINLGVSQATANELSPVTVLAPKDWCPFACEAKAKDKGFQVDIIIEALKSQGVKVNYKNQPYDRAIDSLKKGKVDGISGPFKEEVPFALFPKHITSTTNFCFYGRKGETWRYDGAKSLEGKKLAYASGYAYNKEVDKYIADNPKKVFATKGTDILERNTKLVKAKRADILIEDSINADFVQAEKKFKVVKLNCIPEISNAYFANQSVKKDRAKKVLAAFDKGFETILKNGTLKKVLDKYNLSIESWGSGIY